MTVIKRLKRTITIYWRLNRNFSQKVLHLLAASCRRPKYLHLEGLARSRDVIIDKSIQIYSGWTKALSRDGRRKMSHNLANKTEAMKDGAIEDAGASVLSEKLIVCVASSPLSDCSEEYPLPSHVLTPKTAVRSRDNCWHRACA